MKRNCVRYAVFALVLAMAVVPFASVSAWQAPSTHALIHLTNRSNARATIYFKWGNDPWQKRVIEIGRTRYFNYRYNGQSQRSPDFYIRMDVDTDGVKFVEHVLSRGASPDDNSSRYGHHFTITQLTGTDTRYIQATSRRATVRVTDRNSSRPNI